MSHLACDSITNIFPNIKSKLNVNLIRKHRHPLNLLCKRISAFFFKKYEMPFFHHNNPISTPKLSFDELDFDLGHVSRSNSNTYYLNRYFLLRPHMSAIERLYLSRGIDSFIVAGQVFRRDEIDSSHYPIFHQLEGVFYKDGDTLSRCESLLKSTCEELVKHLFGDNVSFRWQNTFFPFTEPSFEIEVMHNNEWVEVLGCGVLKRKIWAGLRGEGNAWAFGFGLERMAMILFGIPDIRYLWSNNSMVLNQFDYNSSNQFKPIHSEKCKSRDISFWINAKEFNSNRFFELLRDVCEDHVKEVELVI